MVSGFYPMKDENGITVASNDTNAASPAPFYELAYKEYGDKELAWVLSKTDRNSWYALFYGVGKLPKVSDPRTGSATIPNIGLTALRSQQKGQPSSEQLQAYVKYGSHGGWHGHFDRTALLAVDKYGHQFFGTEMCWFGYGAAEYKELVQTSAAHNMVIVDQMQQEAVPSQQPIFYSGDMMQLSVTQTEARWRPIPRNNKDKFPPWDDFDYETEPILQRRLSLVADDYLLMVDYLSSSEEREYDCLVHPLGLEDIEGAQKVGSRQAFVTEDESSPYKYFPNCQWYKGGKDGVKFSFKDNGINLDYYALYPKSADIFCAHYPSTGKAVQGGLRNNPDRRTVAMRSKGKEAIFISMMEPYKESSVVERVEVVSESEIVVYLKDGSKNRITISNLKGKAEDIKVSFEQISSKGKIKRDEN